jgi:hypothetical protein
MGQYYYFRSPFRLNWARRALRRRLGSQGHGSPSTVRADRQANHCSKGEVEATWAYAHDRVWESGGNPPNPRSF